MKNQLIQNYPSSKQCSECGFILEKLLVETRMTNPIQIQGVNFFDNRLSCISHFQKMHWIKKALSLIQSFGTLFIYFLNKIPLSLNRINSQMHHYSNAALINSSKKRLVVCLHGLNNHPTQFKKIVDEMEKRDLSETTIYIPHILQKGNAKLDDMVEPIFKEIQRWAQYHQRWAQYQSLEDKELVLVGISNGGRISRAIEAELIKSGNVGYIKKIKFVSIVGACKGSSLANLAHKLHLSWIMSKNISEEMPTDSKRNDQLNKDLTSGLGNSPQIIREYTFIASPHDWQVPNYDSTLMEIQSHQVRYALIPSHGHNSIVNAAAQAVVDITLS